MYICDYLAIFSDSETSSSSDGEEFDRADRADGRACDEDGFLAVEGKPGLYYKV